MNSYRHVILISMTAALVDVGASAGTLRKTWAFNVADSIPNASAGDSGRSVEVIALSFSPDGRRIAATVGPADQESVLIISATAPQSNLMRFDANPEGGQRTFSAKLSWSPSGAHLLVGRCVINLQSGQSCTVPQEVMELNFLSSAAQVVDRQFRPMRLEVFDTNCRATAEIDLGTDLWNIYDVSPERGTLLVWRQHYRGPGSVDWEISLLAADTGKILRRLSLLEKAGFLDHGQMVCGLRGAEWHRVVECLDADTARPQSLTRAWNAPEIQTARGAKRAIITDYSRKLDWIDWVWRTGSLKHRTIWDFGTRSQVVSWRPKMQKRTALGPVPFSVAISPNGEYLVEGGAGILTLYKIEP